eukprot:TRINITY_DN3965_c0_g1_i1.p1 TRINITY_DN3965_c0_g1~~TRINITY_DN3965_c0_g1_i1.p1  ORF type:complete len:237 (+),score=36.72 TRINITY_DN3965_c0_g1_i1:30-740(+)
MSKSKVSKEGIIELSSANKQIWKLILSRLDVINLLEIATVCKSFYFLLKEDEIFWSLFAENKLKIRSLPNHISSWKKLSLSSLIEWDHSQLNPLYHIDPKDDKLIIDNSKEEEDSWRSAITKNHLLEGGLYPFFIQNLPKYHPTIGVAFQLPVFNEEDSFGVNEHSFGYYFFQKEASTYYCYAKNGKELDGKQNFEDKGTIYVYIHKGSYSDEKNTTANVSFFNKHPIASAVYFHF